MSSRKLKALAINPSAYQRFLRTGRLPEERIVRDTPLLAALRKIPARIRPRLRAFTITRSLGYVGPINFDSVEQAFRWLGGYQRTRLSTDPPRSAESRAIPRFRGPVTWAQLRPQIKGNVPEALEERLAQILR